MQLNSQTIRNTSFGRFLDHSHPHILTNYNQYSVISDSVIYQINFTNQNCYRLKHKTTKNSKRWVILLVFSVVVVVDVLVVVVEVTEVFDISVHQPQVVGQTS